MRSGLQGAKILLGLLVMLLPRWIPVEIIADETITRRKGARIKVKGRYRDAVRSTKDAVVKCYGLKWISLQSDVAGAVAVESPAVDAALFNDPGSLGTGQSAGPAAP